MQGSLIHPTDVKAFFFSPRIGVSAQSPGCHFKMLFNSIKELLQPSDLDLSGSRGFHSSVTVLQPQAWCSVV